MDLKDALARLVARRPHVLLVCAIGGTEVRLAVESELARRCWPAASCPADAAVLVVAGPVGPGLSDVVEALWARVPVPRSRIQIVEPDSAGAALDLVAAELGDAGDWRATVRTRAPGRRPGDPMVRLNASHRRGTSPASSMRGRAGVGAADGEQTVGTWFQPPTRLITDVAVPEVA